jgi:hypothetical protein
MVIFLSASQQNYSILCDTDIKQRQEDDISRVSTVLSISKSEACVLLRYYNWYGPHMSSYCNLTLETCSLFWLFCYC